MRRLEAKGLVRAKVPDGASQPARHRRVYEPTQAGLTAHLAWLRTPVEPATVARDLGLHLLRFVMMEHAFTREEMLGFLGELPGALAAFTAQLERYAGAGHLGGLHPGLALDHGLAVYRASLQWADHGHGGNPGCPLMGHTVLAVPCPRAGAGPTAHDGSLRLEAPAGCT